MQFRLREYRPEDFNTLWQIDQSCFPPNIAYSQFELRTYIRRARSLTLVAESEESGSVRPTILGFLVAESGRNGAGHIITIDVRPEARRHHVGTAVLDAAEARLRAANCSYVRLETAVDNVSALAFYKRHGYDVVQTIPRYYSNGLDALLMEKSLLPPLASG